MIRKFIEKRKARRALDKLLSLENVENVLRDGIGPTQHRRGRIEFVVIFIRGQSPDEISKRISHVSGLARVHGAMIDHIVGALVTVTFGVPPALAEPGAHLRLVQSLQQELGGDIKIVHGAANGHYGIFGENPYSYTFLVPQFDQVLGKLSQLEFGEATEFMPQGQ